MAGQGVYSRSKRAAQAHVNALPNLNATIIPCIIGGAGREGLFRSFVKMTQERGVVAFPGAGRHKKTSMVHVKTGASLIGGVVDGKVTGFFNAAALEALSNEQWIDEIGAELTLGTICRIHLALAPVQALSALTGSSPCARATADAGSAPCTW